MKEIKFRAWDKKDKKMYYDIQSREFRRPDGCGYAISILENKSRHTEIMQYTGLKDDGEKEIYEGDIVKYQRFTEKYTKWETYIVKVGYEEYGFVYYSDEGYTKGFLVANDLSGIEHTSWMQLVKIIGNIYENPELLE